MGVSLGVALGNGQLQREAGAASGLRAQQQRVLQQVGQAAHDGQAQAQAGVVVAGLPWSQGLPTVEFTEHMRQVFGADAAAAVDDAQFHPICNPAGPAPPCRSRAAISTPPCAV